MLVSSYGQPQDIVNYDELLVMMNARSSGGHAGHDGFPHDA